MKLEAGDIVIAVMHSPREKLLGVLVDISPAGVTMRSIDLGYFDDWCRSIAAADAYLSMTDNFFPLWRIERISRDEATDDIPSMTGKFASITGRRLDEM
ncbi:MAG: hypothetical protein WBO10_07575 [Pyrinomonadaceae bacterium]